MTTRSEREKAQKLNEQHQAILSKMLREEDNKYCADCEAKGPRWASWNLGVFICIRCAGIHRNLGVHISRVKSVNLDQWTPEQIQSVQSMGNTKARQLYEAHLPDNFRRPQTDQAVEFFIRDKYEKKKYYDKNAVNDSFVSILSLFRFSESWLDYLGSLNLNLNFLFSFFPSQKREDLQIDSRASPKKSVEPAIDLLGLAFIVCVLTDTELNGFCFSSVQASSRKATGSTASSSAVGTAVPGAQGTAGGAPAQADLDLFSENSGSNSSSNKAEDSTKKPLSKDSILSLYGSSSVPQQPAQAAMFIGASQMQFPAQPQANFQAFPGMGGAMPPTTMMGAVMGQGGAMMGQNTGMMVGMTMPNGFMGNAQAGVMGLAPGMMGAQPGAPVPAGVVPPQNMYAMQPGQQTQWNMGQMNQQMSGMNLNGGGAPMAFGQPGAAMGGWVGPPSGQTLSTQLWK
uniref:Small ArfGAP 1 n=1 Tax=Astyanax mexicanus TaxID=7994 RepID=A0A8B9JKZ2_ASTMX